MQSKNNTTELWLPNSQLMPLRSFVAFLLTSSMLFTPSNTQPQKVNSSNYYKLCAPFKCGNMTFSFPFSASENFGSGPYDCGLPRFQISCDSTTSLPGLELSGRVYRVKDLYQTERLITVVDRQLIDDLRSSSCKSLSNISISVKDGGGASLQVPPWNTSFNFFKCAGGIAMPRRVVGNYSCEEGDFVYLWYDDRWNGSRSRPPDGANSVDTPRGCKLVTVPVFPASLSLYGFLKINSGVFQRPIKNALEVLSDGFPLEWPILNECLSCQAAGGRCGYDGGSKRIICFCKDSCDPIACCNWKHFNLLSCPITYLQIPKGILFLQEQSYGRCKKCSTIH